LNRLTNIVVLFTFFLSYKTKTNKKKTIAGASAEISNRYQNKKIKYQSIALERVSYQQYHTRCHIRVSGINTCFGTGITLQTFCRIKASIHFRKLWLKYFFLFFREKWMGNLYSDLEYLSKFMDTAGLRDLPTFHWRRHGDSSIFWPHNERPAHAKRKARPDYRPDCPRGRRYRHESAGHRRTRLYGITLIDLLLKAAGIVPGQPIPAEIQKIIDEQVDQISTKLVDAISERVTAALTQPPTTPETRQNDDPAARP